MVSEFIIKAQFGNSIRRFCVPINENNQMDIKMVDFRAKICSLFNLTAEAKFTVSYVDEDGDVVHLVDDEDLKDVMRQRLKFLKLDVRWNGILPLEFSQWRNTINKSARKIVTNDEILHYGIAAAMFVGLCSMIISATPKAQPPPKSGWFRR